MAFAYSSAPLRKVKRVQFGILSPDEVVWISLAHHIDHKCCTLFVCAILYP